MDESMIGKKVKYRDETWEVVHVTGERRAVIVRVGVDVKMGVIKVDPFAVMVDPDEIEEIPHELTAKEYAEKLREMFGVKLEVVDNFADLDICNGVNCQECPFDEKRLKAAGYHGNCAALMVYHPELAVKLIDEWQAEKNKPKGKTYLEDIRERLPNVFINKFGIPEGCRKRLCNGIACTDCMPGMEECRKCWNEVMPEEENAEG